MDIGQTCKPRFSSSSADMFVFFLQYLLHIATTTCFGSGEDHGYCYSAGFGHPVFCLRDPEQADQNHLCCRTNTRVIFKDKASNEPQKTKHSSLFCPHKINSINCFSKSPQKHDKDFQQQRNEEVRWRKYRARDGRTVGS